MRYRKLELQKPAAPCRSSNLIQIFLLCFEVKKSPIFFQFQSVLLKFVMSAIKEANTLKNISGDARKIVLVTGGAGFIGSHVAEVLLARGDKVVIIDEMNDYYDVRMKQGNLMKLYEEYGDSNLVVYEDDVCSAEVIDKIFTTENITHVCHLAARAGVRPSIIDPYIYVHSNVEGTTRLLDYSRKFDVQNFVYASSSSVYGSSLKEILTEDDVVDNPVSPYAATKKSCELLAYTFNHLYALPCTGLRFFTVYGPRGRPDMAPFKFIDRVFRKKAIQQYGDGTTSRDYTYITDIVSGVVAAIDRPLGYEVINLGNGRPFQLSSFIKLVEKCVGEKAIIEELPEQPGDVKHTCASIEKAKKLLGYNPQVTFEEGIKKTAEWYAEANVTGLFEEKKEPSGIKRSNSDLELSSYVERSDVRVKKRERRIF
jgi:UDP-glucuronate 4-epimerase